MHVCCLQFCGPGSPRLRHCRTLSGEALLTAHGCCELTYWRAEGLAQASVSVPLPHVCIAVNSGLRPYTCLGSPLPLSLSSVPNLSRLFYENTDLFHEVLTPGGSATSPRPHLFVYHNGVWVPSSMVGHRHSALGLCGWRWSPSYYLSALLWTVGTHRSF